MQSIMKTNFLESTKMIDKEGGIAGVEQVFDYISDVNTVNRLIVVSDMGLPAIAAIAKEIESKFNESSMFPVVPVGDNVNFVNRQNVGRIIKHVMRYYGYLPVAGGLSERARIPNTLGAKYFATGAVYESECKAKLKIKVIQEE